MRVRVCVRVCVGAMSASSSVDTEYFNIEQQQQQLHEQLVLALTPLNPSWDKAVLPKPGDPFAGQAVASQDYGFADLRAVAEQLQQREERIRTLTESLETCKRELKLMTRDRNSEHTRAEGSERWFCCKAFGCTENGGSIRNGPPRRRTARQVRHTNRCRRGYYYHHLHLYLHETNTARALQRLLQ